MSARTIMMKLSRWHVWLGWLVGVPLVMWTLTGLVMVARPIEEVRGNHLRIETPAESLPLRGFAPVSPALGGDAERPVELVTRMQAGQPVTLAVYEDGRSARHSARTGELLPPLDEAAAREVIRRGIVRDRQVVAMRHFRPDEVPLDFRRPEPVWRATLDDGTHVYVGSASGKIDAVRTRWWRLFDLMWGLHIMDLQEREDTSHPILILFAALALLASLMGSVLLFRRRKARAE